MKSSIILILALFFGINNSFFAQESSISSGLYFSSHEVIQDKRTSLHLSPNRPYIFNKNFRIAFDACFRHGDGYYGLICRVISNENTNIDLVANTGSVNTNFWLVYKDQVQFSYSFEEIPESEFGKWIKIYIDFDLKQNILTASFNGIEKKKKITGFSDLRTFDIIFGSCSNPKFQNTDIAPMTLNDVVITDNNKKVYRHWKLTNHALNEVYDEINNDPATVKNGTWLVDKHVKWAKIAALKVPNLVGMAKNVSEGLIYLIGKNELYVYHIQNQRVDTLYYNTGHPFNNYYNYFIYDSIKNKIISYDFSENYLNEFDFALREWKQSSFNYKEPDLAHHNVVISPVDSQITTFGGYGHYMYKARVMKYEPQTSSWQSLDLSNEIYPRYLSAAGLDENNHWLIFGGYGSKSGRQEVSPEFYYDLYSYDFKTYRIKKLQEYKSHEIPFVPCEALVKIPESNKFYTLVYNTSNFATSLRLAEFCIDKSEYTLYSDVIPYNFLDTESWCMFFLHRATSRLVTVTAHRDDVAVYTLAYPALTELNILQASKMVGLKFIFLFSVIVIIGVSILLIFLKKNKRVRLRMSGKSILQEDTNTTIIETVKRGSKSSIYFLGGFQVFDKEGNDISAAFTPTLKQLFIIILLNTVKNERGISTNKLNQTLWFDKSEESARNNRNVSISKLRVILDKVGMIDIDQDSSYWRINMLGVYLDYVELITLCKHIRGQNLSLSETEIQNFVQLAYRGELLPEVQIDWLDEFKADFSNMVLDTLFDFSILPEIKNNFQLLNDIAECILKFDTINEDAITIKCITLCKLGKKGLAKISYDNFSREYQNLLGTPYPLQFNEIIESK